MKLGLVGLPQVGKRTLFRLLAGQEANLNGGRGLGLARVQDALAFHEELQFNDMLFVEKRIERLGKERGKKADAQKAALEADLLPRMRAHLEAGRPLRSFGFTDDEQRLIGSYPLLTRKPVIQVLNVGEDSLRDAGLVGRLSAEFPDQAFEWIAVSAKIEEEISQLGPEEREAFLRALHVDRPALDRLTLLCYGALGLISFFTVGPDEVRAWTIRRGSLAPQAARAIHADLERGFIRAEVMRYQDLEAMGNEQRLKESGRLMQKGRDYVVEDGDIVHFLCKV